MKKSFGKATLGGGNKMSIYMHGYGRSTHNLNKVVRTTMNVGTLIPIYTNIGLNGDTWDIDLNALIKTKPAVAPLFGTYKYQVDVFTANIRLYNSALHNNPLGVGLNMDKVKVPKYILSNPNTQDRMKGLMFSQSSLLAYTGNRGIRFTNGAQEVKMNAIPMLAYYDIFKNYYANKQESQAYVIDGGVTSTKNMGLTIKYTQERGGELVNLQSVYDGENELKRTVIAIPMHGITAIYNGVIPNTPIVWDIDGSATPIPPNPTGTITIKNREYSVTRKNIAERTVIELTETSTGNTTPIKVTVKTVQTAVTTDISLRAFDLENIDKMRETILSKPFYEELQINIGNAEMPYLTNVNYTTVNNVAKYNAESKQNGLCVKTFQSDIFQNWLNTEWVDGVNGISEITKVDTSDGLNLDALNLAQKVYNMLNRIAVSGGSWEDWQEAVYGNNALRRAESPVYHGGMSCRIGFEEVTSNASANDKDGDNQPLGTLAGKGQQFGKKGGRVTIHVNEPCVIMVIASITPFIDYSQGDKWYMRELDTVNDLHKPALDGIGFQNLPQYQLRADAQEGINIGKSPAWIHYMTDVNECYGEFAIGGSDRYMVLQKEFENVNMNVVNSTTYIDPTQFNYTFADNKLSAQNFWVQQAFDIKCRRIMSAKIIPNL